MAAWKAVLVFGLVLSAGLMQAHAADKAASEAEDADDYADEERAHLLVRKWIKDETVVQGRNITIELEVHNAGNMAASAVSIKDSALPDGFELVDGATTASFAKVDAGSKATHSYVARATAAAGVVALEPATVDYKADADGEQVKAASTPAYVEVITPTQQLQRHALTGGRYASLGMLRTTRDWLVAGASFAVLAALFGGNSAYKAASSARASSRRRAALAALEKDQ